ncbi:type VI secretion system tube protein TssD [Aquimarina agarivorans]|uniref:type VI secretion system tube protein TssD n=1 Tax=Aquimarina agarivorans TaxID=980584 RepID=UPI000248E906|nr:type VI secretion system tube protein TssD [Aquimarina agarivorans]
MTHAYLYLDDKKYRLLNFNFSFNQRTGINNKPTGITTGGQINITLETSKDVTMFEWTAHHNMQKNGRIELMSRDGMQIDFKLEFANAYATSATNFYTADTSQPMHHTVLITPGILRFNGDNDIIFKQTWDDGTAFNEQPKPISSRDNTTPEIKSIQWVNSDTEEQNIKEIGYKENLSLLAAINNPEGNSVTITLEKEDGSEFSEGEKVLTFTETLDDAGIVELTPTEIKEQWEAFKTNDIDKLVAKVTHAEASKKSSALQLKPSPQVIVNFRPHSGWQGEFGFDWMRVKDTLLGGDVDYKQHVGSYGAISATKPGAVFTPKNYSKLKAEYTPNNLNGRKDASGNVIKYYTPWLSIYREPNIATPPFAELEVNIEVTAKPDEAYIEFSKKHFDIKGATDSPNDQNLRQYKFPSAALAKTTPGNPNSGSVKLECLHTFPKDEVIKVWAVNKKSDGTMGTPILSGLLNVKANSKANRYKADIVFVEVWTKLGASVKKANPIGREAELEKYMKQALAKPNFETVSLDLSSDSTFNSRFSSRGSIPKNEAKSDAIQDYLIDALYNQYDPLKKNYRRHYKIFFINENAHGLYGRSYGIPSIKRSVVVYAVGFRDSTLAHESFHAMGLHHSFDNNSKHVFEFQKTDNIMDYSDIATPSISVIATWKWQWQSLVNNLDKE